MPAGPAAKVNDMSDPLDKLLSPARLNGLPLRNRILKAATFEGMAPEGTPTPGCSSSTEASQPGARH